MFVTKESDIFYGRLIGDEVRHEWRLSENEGKEISLNISKILFAFWLAQTDCWGTVLIAHPQIALQLAACYVLSRWQSF